MMNQLVEPISCPCCSQPVSVPNVEIVIDHYDLTPREGRILRAVWRGRGHPVSAQKIFDIMYEDDPDGGPAPVVMYRDFKVGLHHLRTKLRGSGIGIDNIGYRLGYRLVIEAGR